MRALPNLMLSSLTFPKKKENLHLALANSKDKDSHPLLWGFSFHADQRFPAVMSTCKDCDQCIYWILLKEKSLTTEVLNIFYCEFTAVTISGNHLHQPVNILKYPEALRKIPALHTLKHTRIFIALTRARAQSHTIDWRENFKFSTKKMFWV